MSLTVGAEFAGYGGAELGLSQVLDLEKRRDDLTDTERAFLVAWGGTWERDETDEADDHHSERADQEAWT